MRSVSRRQGNYDICEETEGKIGRTQDRQVSLCPQQARDPEVSRRYLACESGCHAEKIIRQTDRRTNRQIDRQGNITMTSSTIWWVSN